MLRIPTMAVVNLISYLYNIFEQDIFDALEILYLLYIFDKTMHKVINLAGGQMEWQVRFKTKFEREL